MEHVTSIIGSLAWPLTILIIVWIFRIEFTALIKRIGKIKHGTTEIDFSELKQAVSNVESQHGRENINAEESSDFQQINALLSVDPYSAVIYSWTRFVQAGRNLVEGLDDRRSSDSTVVLKLLKKNEIDQEEFELIKQIQGMRNMAAHDRENGLDELTAFKVTSVLMQLTNEFNKRSKQDG